MAQTGYHRKDSGRESWRGCEREVGILGSEFR